MKIHFRLLKEEDLSQMCIWLNTDFVTQFWKPPLNIKEVAEKFGAYITGEKPTKPYIIMIDDVDIGYIQTYFYSDYPGEYYDLLGADTYSAGIDLFIGHEDYIHKGFGVSIMQAFINEYVFIDPKTVNIIITPEPDNAVAIKVYEEAGFRWYKTIGTQNGESEYLMLLSRDDFYARCTE